MDDEEKEKIELLQWRNSVDYKLSRILSYLENDPKTGKIGAINNILDNTKRLDKVETTDKVRKGQLYILSVIGGFVGGIAMWILKNILFKNQ